MAERRLSNSATRRCGDARALPGWPLAKYSNDMSTLAEIEKAADALPASQKQELMLFLAARLRGEGARLPEPRKFSREQIRGWIAEDEAELERLQRGA